MHTPPAALGRGWQAQWRLIRDTGASRHAVDAAQVTQRLMVAGSGSRAKAAGQSGRLDPAALSMDRKRLNGLQMARKIIRWPAPPADWR